jgi:teichuronic acid biosynthesis glycosyltransferase TuaH
MNLVVFPFHDFRKCQKEGFRTRDGHIMEHLLTAEYIDKLFIINRPINVLECIFKRISWKTEGIIIEKGFFHQIVEIKKNKYVLDCLIFNLIGTILKQKESFFDAYENRKFIEIVNRSIKRLKINNSCCLSFTLYAFKSLKLIDTKFHIFDALDNWLKIPSYKKFFHIIYKGYKSLSKSAKIWTTNSIENKKYFENEFNLKDCVVIRNGVDIDTFNQKLNMPKDMIKFKKPIIGIAAKITHLIDVKLLNKVVNNNHNYDFILIGQILDKKVFNKISNRIYYLGDKHYCEYPSYIQVKIHTQRVWL